MEHGHVCTRCHEPILERGARTHVGHTLACFLRVHTYDLLAVRDGHREYVCVRCGHPLLFEKESDPYCFDGTFAKRVRYLCSLFGHATHFVTHRAGRDEYACACGHTFLVDNRPRATETRIHHPLTCFFHGHEIEWAADRGMLDEYVCVTCGHPFCFTDRAEWMDGC